MPIQVISFDFDGCLFHNEYLRTHEVLDANEPLFAKILREKQDFKSLVVFIGSNRQSYDIDRLNKRAGSGTSCFPAILEIAKYLEATFNPFLMADVSGELPDGESFERAIDPEYDEDFDGPHAKAVFDHTKKTLLYAQMHNIAIANPDHDIVFDFYDDRRDILDELSSFFTNNPILIPSNLTLRLHHYENAMIPEGIYQTIKGIGKTNLNYRATLQEMVGIKDFLIFNVDTNFELSSLSTLIETRGSEPQASPKIVNEAAAAGDDNKQPSESFIKSPLCALNLFSDHQGLMSSKRKLNTPDSDASELEHSADKHYKPIGTHS